MEDWRPDISLNECAVPCLNLEMLEQFWQERIGTIFERAAKHQHIFTQADI